MPETSQKNFWLPGGPGGQVLWGTASQGGGTVFLKSVFLVFLVIFLQTWAEIDARNLPKKMLIPRGGDSKRGTSRGANFLKICILGVFGDISSNLRWDRCQKPPKNVLTPKATKKLKKRFCLYQWVLWTPPKGTPWPRDAHGSPHGSLVWNFNGLLTLCSFSVLKTEKIDTQHVLYH